MNTLYGIIVVIHLIGWAVGLGATVVGLRSRQLPRVVIDGVGTALVTGLILAGMALGGVVDANPPHLKLAIKLVIAAVVLVLAVLARRRKKASPAMLSSIAGLIVVNIAIAVLWH